MASAHEVAEKTTESSIEDNPPSITAATSTAASAANPGTTAEVVNLTDSADDGSRVSRTRKRPTRPPPLDCDVVFVTHVVESPRTKRRRPVVDLGACESDSEIEIVQATIKAVKKPAENSAAGPPATQPTVADGEDIAVVTEATRVRPNVHYAHLRSNCGMHPFGKNALQNLLFCERCFCYVCDEPIESCSSWFLHAFADETKLWWKEIRHHARRTRAGKSTPIPTTAIAEANAERTALFSLGQRPQDGSDDCHHST